MPKLHPFLPEMCGSSSHNMDCSMAGQHGSWMDLLHQGILLEGSKLADGNGLVAAPRRGVAWAGDGWSTRWFSMISFGRLFKNV
jgi:hypothetical protein